MIPDETMSAAETTMPADCHYLFDRADFVPGTAIYPSTLYTCKQQFKHHYFEYMYIHVL